MSANTKIEWCDHSWSPWRGCTKVSPGCANCYAETMSKRNPAVLGKWGKGKPRVLAKNWGDPVRWNKARVARCPTCRRLVGAGQPCVEHDPVVLGSEMDDARPTVFPSLCDWLDDEVSVEWLARFLKLIHDTPNLSWLLLTKRPENWDSLLTAAALHLEQRDEVMLALFVDGWLSGNPPKNVWIGTSVEDQARADERIPELLKIPAAGRFLSLEPLLGPVRLPTHLGRVDSPGCISHGDLRDWISWLIIGGESGHGARPCNVEWIRALVAQGKAAGVPTFVKQLGARPVEAFNSERYAHDKSIGGPLQMKLSHPKGGDPAEWPEDLRVREFPEGLR